MGLLFKLIRLFLAVALVLMVSVTTVEVVRRYIFGMSFVWAEELVKFLLVGLTFIGGAGAFRAGAMAYLDLITSRLNEKWNKIIKLVNNVVIIGVCSFLCSQGFSYTFMPMVLCNEKPRSEVKHERCLYHNSHRLYSDCTFCAGNRFCSSLPR